MTLRFPKPSDTTCDCHKAADLQTKKKDIAALLNDYVQSRNLTTMTLSAPSGKVVNLECDTDDPAELLSLAIGYLNY